MAAHRLLTWCTDDTYVTSKEHEDGMDPAAPTQRRRTLRPGDVAPRGGRGGQPQVETFSAGTDEQNLARAEGFKKMVDAAGQHWPDGWVKGEGFVRAHTTAATGAGGDLDRYTPPPSFADLGEEYVRQIVDLSPGQRRRYLDQVNVLARTEIRGALTFTRPVNAITEHDIKAWLIDWDRALKTKANYHGLIYGVFAYALEQGHIATNPAARTAPKRSRVRQAQAELRFLTEEEFATTARLAGIHADLLTFAVSTGLRFGEATALWCGDVDLVHGTVRVNKAWKRDGEGGETDTPAWLKKALKAKHTMRQYHLGSPKTPRSRRTITIAPAVVELLRPLLKDRAADDLAKAVVEKWFTPAWHAANPDTVAVFEAMVASTPAEGYAAACDALAAMDLRPLLGRITAPTLVISGAADLAIPPIYQAALADGISGAHLLSVPSAAHIANVEEVDVINMALIAHFRGPIG